MSATETPRRPSVRMGEVALALALAARRPATTTESIVTKENAKGEGLIESLATYRGEGEDWQDWVDRHALMHHSLSLAIRPTASEE